MKKARLQTLTAEFSRMKMKETDSVDSFVGKLSELATKSAALGEVIEQPKLVRKFLCSLRRKKYILMTATLEQLLDHDTASFEEVVGRIKAYEERINDEEEEKLEEQGQDKLMYANSDSQPQQERYESGRARGRGGRFGYRGRGRGRNNYGQRYNYGQNYGQKKAFTETRPRLCAFDVIKWDTLRKIVLTDYLSFKKHKRMKKILPEKQKN